MEYKVELAEIQKLRKEAYSLDLPIILALILGMACSFIIPTFTPLFGVFAFFLFYKKILKAAHAPCPRCNHRYGTASNWPIGVGLYNCQNCNLELHKKIIS